MENMIQFQTEKPLESDLLYFVSLIRLDVSRMIRNIHIIVSVLLRYAAIGVSITNSLTGWIISTDSDNT